MRRLDDLLAPLPAKPRRDDANQRFIEILVRVRRALKLHQKDLAAILGHSVSYVCRMERGEVELTLVDFVNLSRALELDPLEVLAKILVGLP